MFWQVRTDALIILALSATLSAGVLYQKVDELVGKTEETRHERNVLRDRIDSAIARIEERQNACELARATLSSWRESAEQRLRRLEEEVRDLERSERGSR